MNPKHTNIDSSLISQLRQCTLRGLAAAALTLVLITTAGLSHGQGVDASPKKEAVEDPQGPVRLRQPRSDDAKPRSRESAERGTDSANDTTTSDRKERIDRADRADRRERLSQSNDPGEFERFVARLVDSPFGVPRLGADLLADQDPDTALSPRVPDDYVIASGDEVLVSLWGTVKADLRLVVDSAGRISLPRVGTISVAGVRYSELQQTVSRRVGQVFKGFQLAVSMGQLRTIRVFVTGQVRRPGAYQVHALATAITALMNAGGPSAAGSFRHIQLRRGKDVVGQIDLYDLIVEGNRSSDRQLAAGDVIHVGAVGTQVAVIGSVNRPVVAELKPGETVEDLLRFGAGFSAVADRKRLSLERLRDRNGTRVSQLELPRDERLALDGGDVVRAFSAVEAVLSTERQSRRVIVEGEVLFPGEYVLPERTSLLDALRAAGGATKAAYLPGTEFTRESVRVSQQANYERALRDLETSLTTHNSSKRVASGDEAAAVQASIGSTSKLIERLRLLRPTGRIVLSLGAEQSALPDLALEDGDRIRIPALPTTIGVFGSVFNAATYLYEAGRTLDNYLQLAGGPTKGADERSIFVVRANGDVISNRQDRSWFGGSKHVGQLKALPGDTVFVPEEIDKQTFIQIAKDWTQLLFQFGVGIAGIKSAIQ